MADGKGPAPGPGPDFEQLFHAMPGQYMILDRDLCYVEANPAYCATALRSREELIGRYVFDAFPPTGEGGAMVEASLRRVLATGVGETLPLVAYPIPAPEGGFRMKYWSCVHFPLFDAAGQVAYVVQNAGDVTERMLGERQRKLLLDELNHRVKNTLATVQAIADQTLRTNADPAAFHKAFVARLLALSATHDLLTTTNWVSADLRDVAQLEFRPYGGERYRLEGPPVDLSSSQALALGLLFHELATNAAKYGALSCGEGCVRVSWEVGQARGRPELQIDWSEHGGPPVAAPSRRGFGSRLIERSLQGQLGGEASLTYAPDGLRCRIRLPLETN